ncbi:helix-turn-helix domain-containing protein [Cupriavidus pauculus]|uniref:Transcriptional regulator n=1 Tax=Cupriavidus pauculus TaxID=82633 RepID=A0A2N5C2R2_9BURK|nr:helix-turn-helix transcriptional regulator [Cupriavidus pauculus]PLP96506.1 transcriptional regulator [Cupriavidus pauculus]
MASQFPIRILTQLNPVLQGFRKSRGLTQADVAARLGVSQQSYARLEANPGRASMARVLAVLQALEVDLVLTPRAPVVASDTAEGATSRRSKPGVPGAKKRVAKAAKATPPRKSKPAQEPGEDW